MSTLRSFRLYAVIVGPGGPLRMGWPEARAVGFSCHSAEAASYTDGLCLLTGTRNSRDLA